MRAAAAVAGVAVADDGVLEVARLRAALPGAKALHRAAEGLRAELSEPAGNSARHAALVRQVDEWVDEVLAAARSLRAGPAVTLGVALQLPKVAAAG